MSIRPPLKIMLLGTGGGAVAIIKSGTVSQVASDPVRAVSVRDSGLSRPAGSADAWGDLGGACHGFGVVLLPFVVVNYVRE